MTDTTAATDLLEALEVVTCCLAWHAEYHGTDVDRRVVSAARAVLVNATGRTALGAALLAGMQAGLFPSLDSVAATWQLDRAFAPQEDKAARDQRYAGWQAAVKRVRSTA